MKKENNKSFVEKWLATYETASAEDKKEIVKAICTNHGSLVCRVVTQLDKCRIRK